jgi:TolB-like protein
VPRRPEPAFQVGEVVASRYRIIRHLRSVNDGEIYEAVDREVGERVEVRSLRNIVPARDAQRAFEREFKIARRLLHPNIGRIFHFARARSHAGTDVAFLVSEPLQGITLAEKLRGSPPLELRLLLPIFRQIASALTAAHEAGVIHRGLNPERILLMRRPQYPDRVVVIDFALDLVLPPIVTTSEQLLTAAEDYARSVAYLAPEQIAGGEVTAATDVYAFATIVFEALSGRKPFEADDPVSSTVRRLSEQPPSLGTLVPRISPSVDEAVSRCLQRDPRRRLNEAAELIARIDPGSKESLPLPRPVRSTAITAALSVALVVGLAFAAVWTRQRGAAAQSSAARPDGRSAVAVVGFMPVTGSARSQWLEKKLAEGVTAQVSSPEVRIVPAERVLQSRADLSIPDGTLSPRDLARLRQTLSSDWLITGSYTAAEKAAGRVAVTLQLVNVATGTSKPLAAEGEIEPVLETIGRAVRQEIQHR